VTIRAIHDAMRTPDRIGIRRGEAEGEDIDTSDWLISKRMREMREDEDDN
jgi:hypothetical protein